MDLASLQDLVRRSSLLSDSDRKYWLENLPTMKPDHVAKLEKILAEGEQINVGEKVTAYFQVINKAAKPSLAA